MTTCPEVKKLLAIPDADRTTEESQRVEAHLAECTTCAREARIFASLDGLLTHTLAREVDQVGRALLRQPVAPSSRNVASHPLTLRLAVAAAVLLMAGTVYFAFRAGQAQTESALLHSQLEESRNRCARLEDQLSTKDRDLALLNRQLTQGLVRHVSYNIYTTGDAEAQPGKAFLSRWNRSLGQLQGVNHGHDF